MVAIPWSTDINFASALLLHSCTTILLKEIFNSCEIARRILIRLMQSRAQELSETSRLLRTSIVLDAYTSVFSRDVEVELAEPYFTNAGVILLAVSLASSVAMNLLLPSLLLNMIVAGTFGLTFAASLLLGRKATRCL